MLKKLLILGIGIFMLSLVSPYTAPTYNSINFSLCSGYTIPTYNSINFSLATTDVCVSDSCTCPGLATNWEISLADYCNITANCNISTGNITFINNGSVLFNATLTVYEIDWKNEVGVVEEYNLGSNFRGWVG